MVRRSEVVRSLRHYLRAQKKGHHTIDRLDERGVERDRGATIFLERTREGHRQSDEHWNSFKGNVGEISEKRGGAHEVFSARIDTILNWTELLCFLWLRLHTFYVISAFCYWGLTHFTWWLLPVTVTAHIVCDRCFLWPIQHTYHVINAFCSWDCTLFTWSGLSVAETAYFTSPNLSVTETAHILRHQSFMWLRLHTFYVISSFRDWVCTHFTSRKLYAVETAHILRHQSFMWLRLHALIFTWSALPVTETAHILRDQVFLRLRLCTLLFTWSMLSVTAHILRGRMHECGLWDCWRSFAKPVVLPLGTSSLSLSRQRILKATRLVRNNLLRPQLCLPATLGGYFDAGCVGEDLFIEKANHD